MTWLEAWASGTAPAGRRGHSQLETKSSLFACQQLLRQAMASLGRRDKLLVADNFFFLEGAQQGERAGSVTFAVRFGAQKSLDQSRLPTYRRDPLDNASFRMFDWLEPTIAPLKV